MERKVYIHIDKLPEGIYLATSDNLQGLVVQGRTIQETIEFARDVAKKLLEMEEAEGLALPVFEDSFDYPIVVGV
jgi:predicted RNase H-like HicB family nuclease